MKITHNKVGQNLNLSDLNKTDKAESAKNEKVNAKKINHAPAQELLENTKNEAVKVDLSTQAKDIRQAKELAMASPDIDFNKVEKFQKLIDEGKYKVDSKAVADRMVEDSLMMASSQRTGDE
jgi:negative regulator of flagellin synthesis FlgM